MTFYLVYLNEVWLLVDENVTIYGLRLGELQLRVLQSIDVAGHPIHDKNWQVHVPSYAPVVDLLIELPFFLILYLSGSQDKLCASQILNQRFWRLAMLFQQILGHVNPVILLEELYEFILKVFQLHRVPRELF